MSPSERRGWNSGARIDATTVTVMVEARTLRARLSEIGVQLGDAPDVPVGMHPLILDLWSVESARIEVGGVDQHAWSALTGATAMASAGGWAAATASSGLGAIDGAFAGGAAGASFGPLGWCYGTIAGFFAGGASGSLRGWAEGAVQGATLGADFAEGVSDRMSRAFGTYEEVLVAVPYAHLSGHDGGPYLFVLGMLSNGALAIWGDRTLKCGYRKAPATIVREGFHRYEVRGTAPGTASAALVATDPACWSTVDSRLDPYLAVLSQPLLGRLDDGSFAATSLGRFLDTPGVRWAPFSGRLTVAAGFVEGVPEGDYPVQGLAERCPWGAFRTEALPVKVSFPHSIRTGPR